MPLASPPKAGIGGSNALAAAAVSLARASTDTHSLQEEVARLCMCVHAYESRVAALEAENAQLRAALTHVHASRAAAEASVSEYVGATRSTADGAPSDADTHTHTHTHTASEQSNLRREALAATAAASLPAEQQAWLQEVTMTLQTLSERLMSRPAERGSAHSRAHTHTHTHGDAVNTSTAASTTPVIAARASESDAKPAEEAPRSAVSTATSSHEDSGAATHTHTHAHTRAVTPGRSALAVARPSIIAPTASSAARVSAISEDSHSKQAGRSAGRARPSSHTRAHTHTHAHVLKPGGATTATPQRADSAVRGEKAPSAPSTPATARSVTFADEQSVAKPSAHTPTPTHAHAPAVKAPPGISSPPHAAKSSAIKKPAVPAREARAPAPAHAQTHVHTHTHEASQPREAAAAVPDPKQQVIRALRAALDELEPSTAASSTTSPSHTPNTHTHTHTHAHASPANTSLSQFEPPTLAPAPPRPSLPSADEPFYVEPSPSASEPLVPMRVSVLEDMIRGIARRVGSDASPALAAILRSLPFSQDEVRSAAQHPHAGGAPRRDPASVLSLAPVHAPVMAPTAPDLTKISPPRTTKLQTHGGVEKLPPQVDASAPVSVTSYVTSSTVPPPPGLATMPSSSNATVKTMASMLHRANDVAADLPQFRAIPFPDAHAQSDDASTYAADSSTGHTPPPSDAKLTGLPDTLLSQSIYDPKRIWEGTSQDTLQLVGAPQQPSLLPPMLTASAFRGVSGSAGIDSLAAAAVAAQRKDVETDLLVTRVDSSLTALESLVAREPSVPGSSSLFAPPTPARRPGDAGDQVSELAATRYQLGQNLVALYGDDPAMKIFRAGTAAPGLSSPLAPLAGVAPPPWQVTPATQARAHARVPPPPPGLASPFATASYVNLVR